MALSGFLTNGVLSLYITPFFSVMFTLSFIYMIWIARSQRKELVNYFRRFRDIFFGPDPAEILKLTPHKKSWILQAMRHFGNYYNYKTNNPECKELMEKIINRYGLNIGLDMHQKICISKGRSVYRS